MRFSLFLHSLGLDKFKNPKTSTIIDMKNKLRLKDDDYPIVGIVSRYIHVKGIQYIIPTFAKVTKEYPNAQLLLGNTISNDNVEIQNLLSSKDYTK